MYDYIISGAGCAGLSLVMAMIRSGGFGDRRILLVDAAPKTGNDRTWCYWEPVDKPGPFEAVVRRQWDRLRFYGHDGYASLTDIRPYRYKMIRGLDFYQYCHEEIRQQDNITLLYSQVESIYSDDRETYAMIDGVKVFAEYIFNSIRFKDSSPKSRYHYLLQHFAGWTIRTNRDSFQPGEATLMDFRVDQERGACFAYTLPFSRNEALVEYTYFTEGTFASEVYERGLQDYLHRFLKVEEYTVLEKEYGVIPMTDQPFIDREHRILHIGTAGGCTKPSSGYTFQFIQKQCKAIVDSLVRRGDPFGSIRQDPGLNRFAQRLRSNRFYFYDSVLLNVLATGKVAGDRVFTELFRKNRIEDIFLFLDNESGTAEEYRIIRSLPVWPFLRAAIQQAMRSVG